MIFMENDRRNISELIEVLVNPTKPIKRIHIWIRLLRNENYILNHFYKGEVEEHLLLCLLKKSIYNNKIKRLLPDILYYVEVCSITDAVLDFSMAYPGIFRETLLTLLAHMWLSVEHLDKINRCIQTPEAFCKLFYYFAKDDQCSDSAFGQFLYENKHHLKNVDCFDLIDSHGIRISNNKLIFFNNLISDESDIN